MLLDKIDQQAVQHLIAGFAVVKRGRDKQTGQDAAIKVQHAFRHTAGQPKWFRDS